MRTQVRLTAAVLTAAALKMLPAIADYPVTYRVGQKTLEFQVMSDRLAVYASVNANPLQGLARQRYTLEQQFPGGIFLLRTRKVDGLEDLTAELSALKDLTKDNENVRAVGLAVRGRNQSVSRLLTSDIRLTFVDDGNDAQIQTVPEGEESGDHRPRSRL